MINYNQFVVQSIDRLSPPLHQSKKSSDPIHETGFSYSTIGPDPHFTKPHHNSL